MLVLVMESQGQWYAIPAAKVEEVTPAMPWRAIPGVPPYVRGVFEYRGNPVPVVDLTYLLHQRPAVLRLSTRILILPLPGNDLRFLGLLAEHALEALDIPQAMWNENRLATLTPDFLGDLSFAAERSVQLIDPQALLPEDLRQAIGLLLSEEAR